MSKTLKIAPNLTLPLEAVTQTFAIMAKRGVGKTHTASVMAEEMLKQGQPIVVYDPTSAWWGLKSSVDGKRPGFPIVIFGGEHADVPLEETAGETIARVIVEKRLPAILDVGLLRKGARIRFMTAFCETLYHRNREALHFFIDEAQTVAPQNVRAMPEMARLVGALEDILLQGRRRGLGATVVSPRPAIVNTSIRSACEVLIAMQIVGPHDRKAIQEWVDLHGDDADRAREMMASLASLKRGEAWVWSPAWLELFTRTAFRQRETFDSSATPKVGGRVIEPQTVAAVDLVKLGEEIAATVERAKADDPKELRRQLAAKDAELATLRKAPAAAPAKTLEVSVLTDADRKKLDDMMIVLDATLEAVDAKVNEALARVLAPLQKHLAAIEERVRPIVEKAAAATPTRAAAPPPSLPTAMPPRRAPIATVPREVAPGALTGPEQRILNACAWLESVGQATPKQVAVAFLAGYTYGGGAFNNPRGALRTKGFIEYVPGDMMRLTDSGRAAAVHPETALTAEAIQTQALAILPGPEQKILRACLAAYPEALANDECARQAGYEPGGGAFNNPRGRLRSLGLVEYPQPGFVRAASVLFLEQRAA